ncbi:MAG TPA: DUF5069 domain-containing protein [Chthoniobacterales bacterium]
MNRRIYPRSPYAQLGGYVHLPRLIDKARLHHQGLLVGYNYKTSGFDRHLLAFLGVDGDTFEAKANEFTSDDLIWDWLRATGVSRTPAEIQAWNDGMISQRPDTLAKQERFNRLLHQMGGTLASGVHTYFDLIEFEERRAEFLVRKAGQKKVLE